MVVADSYLHYQGSKRMHAVRPNGAMLNYVSFVNKGNMMTPECAFYKKEIYGKAGGLDLGFKYLSDYDLWIRMLKLDPVVIKIPIFTSVYEVRQDALLRRNFKDAWKELFLIGEKFHRSFVSKLKFKIIYFGLLIRAPFLSIITKSPFLIKLFIRIFR